MVMTRQELKVDVKGQIEKFILQSAPFSKTKKDSS